jgi:hypothetical protein
LIVSLFPSHASKTIVRPNSLQYRFLNFPNSHKNQPKTFKPIKGGNSESRKKEIYARIYSTLGAGVNVNDLVKLPEGEDLNEWLAINSKFCLWEIII